MQSSYNECNWEKRRCEPWFQRGIGYLFSIATFNQRVIVSMEVCYVLLPVLILASEISVLALTSYGAMSRMSKEEYTVLGTITFLTVTFTLIYAVVHVPVMVGKGECRDW